MNEPARTNTGIYLDHAATTPVDPRVLEAMLPYFTETFGNPSSLHTPGQRAREAIDRARRTIAGFLGAPSIQSATPEGPNPQPTPVTASEIIFTSGGTESNNLALFGIAEAYRPTGPSVTPGHLITTAIEHESVLEPMATLEKAGFTVTRLPVDREGFVKLDALEGALTLQTTLVSIMAANNEIGTIQPLVEIANLLKKYRKSLGRTDAEPPFLHTDACQAAGVLDLHMPVDLLTLNGGKIYGSKGVGVLFVRKEIKLVPRLVGGGQERRLRAGTQNVPAIVGMARALEIAQAERTLENERLTALRNRLYEGLRENLPDLTLNGDLDARLPNNLNLCVPGAEGEILLMRLDMEGIYASAGSACTSGKAEPSHVLLALGRSKQEAYNAVRFSLGKSNTPEQIDRVIETFTRIVIEIRGESGVYA